MTDRLFNEIWADAQAQGDRDAFVSDWALSSAFGGPEDPIDEEIVEQLVTMWDVAHEGFSHLLSRALLGQTACATRFCIPLRTVQHWANGTRQCPSYILLMIAEATYTITIRSYKQAD